MAFGDDILGEAAIAGFVLGLGLIFSIGPRTLQLVRAGLTGFHPTASATTSYACDFVVVGAAIGGVGAALAESPGLTHLLQLLGIAFLLWTGSRALMRTRRAPAAIGLHPGAAASRRAAVMAMLAVSWLNPLFYLEVLLLVVLASSYGADGRLAFAAGYLLAAPVKSYGWTTLGAVFAPMLGDPRWRARFEAAAGLVLITAAVVLTSRVAGVA